MRETGEYFCDECEAQMGRRTFFKSVAGLLLCATLAAFALNRALSPSPNIPSNGVASTPIVSARDTVTTPKPELKPELAERALCGARTRKGTPCKRLTPPGQRCAQHRGMKSLLEKTPGTPAPAMDKKTGQ
jgi:hypothetical protein